MRRRLIICCALLVLAFVSFSHVMTRPLEHNEQMYVACSVLMMDHQLYEDFAFVQMPFVPICYSTAYSIVGTRDYLLVSRFVTWIFLLLAFGAMIWLGWLLRRSIGFGVVAAWWIALSGTVVIASGECSNYVIPLAMSLLGLGCWCSSLRSGTRWSSAKQFASGILLSLAVASKLYYVVVIGPFFVLWLLARNLGWGSAPSGSSDTLSPDEIDYGRLSLRTSVIPFCSGLMLGLMPVFYFLVRSPDQFMFNNLFFHLRTGDWYESIGYSDRMSLFQRLQYAKSWMQDGSHLPLLLVATVLIAVHAASRAEFRSRRFGISCLSLMIVISCCCAALSPVPAWPQYFAMPVPFCVVLVLSTAGLLSGRDRIWGDRLIMCGFLVSLLVTGPYYVRSSVALLDRENWTPIRIHAEAEELRTELEQRASETDSRRIATLAPIHVLEAGFEVYPELSTGPFLYYLGSELSDAERDLYVGTSPAALQNILHEGPPLGFWLGFENSPTERAEDPEDSFWRAAVKGGYRERGHLWIRY